MTGPVRWRKGGVFLLAALVLAALIGGWWLISPEQTASTQVTVAPRGELFSNPPPASPEDMTDAAAKKRHPKPPSVQRRMVLAQAVLAQSGDAGNLGSASGTAGTAADWVKSNGALTTNVAAKDVQIPGYQSISFNTLAAFDFPVGADGNPKIETPIPANVQSLNGKKAVVAGFLLPVTMKDGLAVEFLLMRNQSMCCYGVPPKINEWITVQAVSKGVKPVMDQPILVAGTLRVGPTLENGSLAGIYRMDADKIIEP
jgi:hypothetical protein